LSWKDVIVAFAWEDVRLACSYATCIVRQLFGIAEAGDADTAIMSGTTATALATAIPFRIFIS